MCDQQRAVHVHRHGGPTLRYDPRDACPNSRISADARKEKPDLEGHTRPTEILKTSPTQHTFQRKGRLPQRVPSARVDGLDEQEIPALDDEFPIFSNAEVQDGGREHEKATIDIDDISHGAALELHLPLRCDRRVGGIERAERIRGLGQQAGQETEKGPSHLHYSLTVPTPC